MIGFLQPKLSTHQSSNQLKNSFEQQTNRPSAQMRRNYVLEIDDTKKINIEIDPSEAQQLTCGWLFSEFIRKMIFYVENYPEDFENARKALEIGMLGIKTKEGNPQMDFYISLFDRDLVPIKSGQVFLPIFQMGKHVYLWTKTLVPSMLEIFIT
jgi:hypothetical protein